LRVGGALEDARGTVAARLAELGDDFADHIAILKLSMRPAGATRAVSRARGEPARR
jgi:hypothetical protein